MKRYGIVLAVLVAAVLTITSCARQTAQAEKDKVRLQLKWVTQAQFAGYYAAKEKGLYAQENIDATIIPGGPDIVPEQVVAGGGAEFGIDWLPSLLSAREQGTPLVNVAQVFQYSGMREVAYKTSGIKTPADLKGRKVAVWFGGNEFELLATLEKYKLDRNKDVTLVQQPFDMNLLVSKQVAAAAAMTYNEYKQVLDAGAKPGRRALPAGVPERLGVLSGPCRRVHRHRAETESHPGQRAPDLDDARNQQTHLGATRADRRGGLHGPRRLHTHRGHRLQVQGDQAAGDGRRLHA